MTRERLNEYILSLYRGYSDKAYTLSKLYTVGSCRVFAMKPDLFLARNYIEILAGIKLDGDPEYSNGCLICYNEIPEDEIEPLICATQKALNTTNKCTNN